MKEITRTPQSGPAKKDRNLTRWLFVAPAMLVVLCLLVYPLCSTLLYSFTNKTLIKSTYVKNILSMQYCSESHTGVVFCSM